MHRCLLAGLTCLGLIAASPLSAAEEQSPKATPQVGDTAPDFELESLRGPKIRLRKIGEDVPVVIIVLRGWPGYHCPACTRQVGTLLLKAKEIAATDAQVLLIYPGPPEKLKERADEFLGKTKLPANFHMLLDPDYTFTNRYHLRWDAPRETAHPAAFVLDAEGKVRFVKVSRGHADRSNPKDIIRTLQTISAE